VGSSDYLLHDSSGANAYSKEKAPSIQTETNQSLHVSLLGRLVNTYNHECSDMEVGGQTSPSLS
jgi:hypothetical protein